MLITGCLISCFPLMEQKQPPEYLICAIATTAGNTSCTCVDFSVNLKNRALSSPHICEHNSFRA